VGPRRVALLAFATVLAASCAEKPERETAADVDETRTPVVYTTTYPLTYFIERIAPGIVEVRCPVPPEEDPQFWNPARETVVEFQKADLIVMNGAQLEKWELRAFLPITRVIHAANPLEDEYIVLKSAITHSHGPTGKHSHEGVDGYVWPDPVNAIAQAREIEKGLARAFPRHAAAFEANLGALVRDLKSLDASLAALTKGYDGRTILTSHPLYNYIARRYGWKIHSLLLEPDEMPPDSEFVSLKTIVQKTGARYLIWEAAPPREVTARMARELGLTSVVFRHCATIEDDERAAGVDYLKIMKQNIENIRPVFASRD